MERPEFKQYLMRKVSNINGELIILKGDAVIFTSKDVNKIDLEKCLLDTKSKDQDKLVVIDTIAYSVEVVPIKFKDNASRKCYITRSFF